MKKSVTRRFICLFIACCNLLFLFGCSNPVEGDESFLPPQSSTSDTSLPDTTEPSEPLEETKGLTYRLNEEKDGYVLYGIGSNNKKGATIVIPSSHEGLPVIVQFEAFAFNFGLGVSNYFFICTMEYLIEHILA